MIFDWLIGFMRKHGGNMPLAQSDEWLDQYLCKSALDGTMAVTRSGKDTKGVVIWQTTTEEKGEPDIWAESDPEEPVVVVNHLVARDRHALAALSRTILSAHNFDWIWGEHAGKRKRYSRKFIERLARYGQEG